MTPESPSPSLRESREREALQEEIERKDEQERALRALHEATAALRAAERTLSATLSPQAYNINDDDQDEGIPPALPDLPPVETVLQEFARITDPFSRRKKWTTSRVGYYPDNRMETVLEFLAKRRFGPYNTKHLAPYWKDADWKNETWENIGLHIKSQGDRTRNNPYGVPAGSPEYWKRYREANKDRVKQYHVRSQLKTKAIKEKLAEIDLSREEAEIKRLLDLP